MRRLCQGGHRRSALGGGQAFGPRKLREEAAFLKQLTWGRAQVQFASDFVAAPFVLLINSRACHPESSNASARGPWDLRHLVCGQQLRHPRVCVRVSLTEAEGIGFG